MPVPLDKILSLSTSERLWLIDQISENLAAELDALRISETQRVILDRRLDVYERNPSEVLIWEEVWAELERLG